MVKQTDNLPLVLTSLAFRKEYFPELEGMLATAKQHIPRWSFVIGRGSVSGFESPTLESPLGRQQPNAKQW